MARGDAQPDLLCAAALRLFAANGVSGTSLQMIADALGVTKAALYYHYKTKDDIVRAVLEPAIEGLADILRNADDLMTADDRRHAVIVGLADQAIAHHEVYAVMLRDVSVTQLAEENSVQNSYFGRAREILAGPEPTASTRLRVGMFLTGLIAPAVDADIANLNGDNLHQAIVDAGHRLLD